MTTPNLGDILYLASCVMKVGVSATVTPPSTPNQYTADLKVMGDRGDIDLSAIVGQQGPPGRAEYALRLQEDLIDNPADLPVLSNITQDIGKYWLIDEVDPQGHILNEWAYIWWGNRYRIIMMGARGAPGPVPKISPKITVIPPDHQSYVHTSGSTFYPSWEYMLAAPAGISGPVSSLYQFPDMDEVTNAPVSGDVLSYTGRHTRDGYPQWAPFNIDQLSPAPYSMPESAFTGYAGVSHQAAIGSFAVPPQPFPWTPVVWGHLKCLGLNTAPNAFMIGCQVLLGDPSTGTMISRGLGNTLGEVNIMPHYSTPQKPGDAVSPANKRAVIPAHHTGSQGTVYINLWNDGQVGAYIFNPTDAHARPQLFILAVPVHPVLPPATSAYPAFSASGKLKATARRGS